MTPIAAVEGGWAPRRGTDQQLKHKRSKRELILRGQELENPKPNSSEETSQENDPVSKGDAEANDGDATASADTPEQAQTDLLEILTNSWKFTGDDSNILNVKEKRPLGATRDKTQVPQAPQITVRVHDLALLKVVSDLPPDARLGVQALLWDYGAAEPRSAKGAGTNNDGKGNGVQCSATAALGGSEFKVLQNGLKIQCERNLAVLGMPGTDQHRYANVRCSISRAARIPCKRRCIAFRLQLVSLQREDRELKVERVIEEIAPIRTVRISISEKAMCPRSCDIRKRQRPVEEAATSQAGAETLPMYNGAPKFFFQQTQSQEDLRKQAFPHFPGGAPNYLGNPAAFKLEFPHSLSYANYMGAGGPQAAYANHQVKMPYQAVQNRFAQRPIAIGGAYGRFTGAELHNGMVPSQHNAHQQAMYTVVGGHQHAAGGNTGVAQGALGKQRKLSFDELTGLHLNPVSPVASPMLQHQPTGVSQFVFSSPAKLQLPKSASVENRELTGACTASRHSHPYRDNATGQIYQINPVFYVRPETSSS